MNQGWTYCDRITPASAGQTVLTYYAQRYQHSTAQQWQSRIEQGQIHLDNQPVHPHTRLKPNQTLSYHRSPWAEPNVPLTFDILHEDDALWAIAKPAGLPVLPGGKFLQHTLLHQLKARYPNENPIPIHRLGRGTSGVMLIAKTQQARRDLSAQFRARTANSETAPTLTKTYRALIGPAPHLPNHFTCTDAIGKIPYPHLGYLHARIAPHHPTAKPAQSDCQILQRRPTSTLLQVNIITGRPHQIRIHLAAQGHPLLGDPLYQPGGIPHPAARAIPSDCGYHLHAHCIRLIHPHSGKTLYVEAPLPEILKESSG